MVFVLTISSCNHATACSPVTHSLSSVLSSLTLMLCWVISPLPSNALLSLPSFSLTVLSFGKLPFAFPSHPSRLWNPTREFHEKHVKSLLTTNHLNSTQLAFSSHLNSHLLLRSTPHFISLEVAWNLCISSLIWPIYTPAEDPENTYVICQEARMPFFAHIQSFLPEAASRSFLRSGSPWRFFSHHFLLSQSCSTKISPSFAL